MLRSEDEKWEQFRDLTEIMENAGQKQPGEDFTAKVMSLLPEEMETEQPFSLGRLFPTDFNFGFRNSVTKTECAFYFFLTGFFYFILGLIMMIGLPLPVMIRNNGWLSIQPLFGILLSSGLIALGIVLYKKGESAIRFVRIGTILYVALIILNGWIGTLYIEFAASIFFVAVFSLTGLVFAVLLGLALDHYSPETIFSEVSG